MRQKIIRFLRKDRIMDRNRPYNGQSHTDEGERGKTLVEGLTMRDVADCMVIGFLEASGSYLENPTRNDIYNVSEPPSPGAAIQCAMCTIEKMMGIFPNIQQSIGVSGDEPKLGTVGD